ncbi:MAG: hypothetical protein R3B06_09155 [Kofleriaceae bacterium]
MKRLAILSILVAACGGKPGRSSTPAVGNAGPNVNPAGVRAIDWDNRTYQAGDASYTVKDGQLEFAYDGDGNPVAGDYQPTDPDEFVERGSFQVLAHPIGDVTGDGVDEAVVLTAFNGGGSGYFTGIDVYAMVGAEPEIIGGIPGGDRGDGGIASVAIADGVVTVERFMSTDEDGACCPSQLQHERWRWDGKTFVEDVAARRLVANDEGR